MKVTKTSMFTGKVHTLELDVTQEQLDEFAKPGPRRLVQNIFPNLTPEEREFIMTGVTRDEWNEEFGDDE